MSLSKQPSLLTSLLASYLTHLSTRPLETKAITSMTLKGIEELSAQQLSGQKIDIRRIIKMALYGLLINGPLGHVLYTNLLGKLFEGKSGALVSILQLLISNVIFAPIENYIYLYSMAYINGKQGSDIQKSISQGFWPMMKLTWQLSPLIQILTFKFLPPLLWVPFFNIIGFVFGVFFNVLNKKK